MNKIRELRKANGLTLEEFGKRIGCTGASVSMIETGKRSPSGVVLNSICKEFSVNLEWLRDGIGNMYEDETEAKRDYIINRVKDMSSEDLNTLTNFIELVKNKM